MSATLTTEENVTPAESSTRSRHDLRRWRDDWHALCAQIAETKKAMRTGIPTVDVTSPDFPAYQAHRRAQGEAQSALHGLRAEATALLIFRAALRGRAHAPKLDADHLRSILARNLTWQAMSALRNASADQLRARIIGEVGKKYERSHG